MNKKQMVLIGFLAYLGTVGVFAFINGSPRGNFTSSILELLLSAFIFDVLFLFGFLLVNYIPQFYKWLGD